MYLIGDIGNTETKICLFDNNSRIKKKVSFKTKLISNKYLKQKLNFLKLNKIKVSRILFCSVVPKSFKVIKLYLQKKIKVKCKELKDVELKSFVKIKVNKKQIGSDRIANAISVIDNKSNFIILDFGTATTFDVVIKNNYLGGVIAPGVSLSLENLVNKASLIPSIKLSNTKYVIGKNTNNAVRSGFYWGYAGLINNIINLIIKQTRKNFKIIFTGGLSHLFKNSIKNKVITNKDLTVKGLLKVVKQLD